MDITEAELQPGDAADPASFAVHHISLEDLVFNLNKKMTMRSKRAVGIEELQLAIKLLSQVTYSEDIENPAINDTSPSFLSVNRVGTGGDQEDEEPKPMHWSPARVQTPHIPPETGNIPGEREEYKDGFIQETVNKDESMPFPRLSDLPPKSSLDLAHTVGISIDPQPLFPLSIDPTPPPAIPQASPPPRDPSSLTIVYTSRIQIRPEDPEPVPATIIETELVRVGSIAIPASESESSLVIVSRVGTIEVRSSEIAMQTIDQETTTERVEGADKGENTEGSSLGVVRLEGISVETGVRTPKFEPVSVSVPVIEETHILSPQLTIDINETEEPKDIGGVIQPILVPSEDVSAENTVMTGEEGEVRSQTDTLRAEIESTYATVIPIVEDPSEHEHQNKAFARTAEASLLPKSPSNLRRIDPIVHRRPIRRKVKPNLLYVNPILRHLEGNPMVPFQPPLQGVKKIWVKRELIGEESEYGRESPNSLPPIFSTEVSRTFTEGKTTSSRKASSFQSARYNAAHINYDSSLLEKPFSPFRCTKIVPTNSFKTTRQSMESKEGRRDSEYGSKAENSLRSESESPGGINKRFREKRNSYRVL